MSGVAPPVFPRPPDQYSPAYMASVIRAFSAYVEQIRSAQPAPYKQADTNASVDGVVMWDPSAGELVVSSAGAWDPVAGTAPVSGPVAYARIEGSNYVLTSTTSTQRLFNVSANGAVTLATGRYYFRHQLWMSSMSATSGNAQFNLVGAGTATVASIFYTVDGIDSTTPLTAPNARTGTASSTSASAATNIVSAGTGTGLIVNIVGHFNVTSAGTLIPSIALSDAAAANVNVGTWIAFWRLADTGSTTVGTWS